MDLGKRRYFRIFLYILAAFALYSLLHTLEFYSDAGQALALSAERPELACELGHPAPIHLFPTFSTALASIMLFFLDPLRWRRGPASAALARIFAWVLLLGGPLWALGLWAGVLPNLPWTYCALVTLALLAGRKSRPLGAAAGVCAVMLLVGSARELMDGTAVAQSFSNWSYALRAQRAIRLAGSPECQIFVNSKAAVALCRLESSQPTVSRALLGLALPMHLRVAEHPVDKPMPDRTPIVLALLLAGIGWSHRSQRKKSEV